MRRAIALLAGFALLAGACADTWKSTIVTRRTQHYRLPLTDNEQADRTRACYEACARDLPSYSSCLGRCPGAMRKPGPCDPLDRFPGVACGQWTIETSIERDGHCATVRDSEPSDARCTERHVTGYTAVTLGGLMVLTLVVLGLAVTGGGGPRT